MYVVPSLDFTIFSKKESLGLTIKHAEQKHNIAFMNKLVNISCGRARGPGGMAPQNPAHSHSLARSPTLLSLPASAR